MVKFTHYLVTRFNVPEARWQRDRSGYSTLDEHWFDHRMDLFATYCVPSVKYQSQQNFLWIIYCGSATDPRQLERITQSVQGMVNTSVRMAENLDRMVKDLQGLLSSSPDPYVITTRLDNDDGVEKDFIHNIQSHFTAKDSTLIHFDHGILYDCHRHIATRSRSTGFNIFTSLVERKKDPNDLITIYGFHHTDIPGAIDVVRIKGGAHWLKILHERNVRSQLSGIPLFISPRRTFGHIKTKNLHIAPLNSLAYMVKRWWKLFKN